MGDATRPDKLIPFAIFQIVVNQEHIVVLGSDRLACSRQAGDDLDGVGGKEKRTHLLRKNRVVFNEKNPHLLFGAQFNDRALAFLPAPRRQTLTQERRAIHDLAFAGQLRIRTLG